MLHFIFPCVEIGTGNRQENPKFMEFFWHEKTKKNTILHQTCKHESRKARDARKPSARSNRNWLRPKWLRIHSNVMLSKQCPTGSQASQHRTREGKCLLRKAGTHCGRRWEKLGTVACGWPVGTGPGLANKHFQVGILFCLLLCVVGCVSWSWWWWWWLWF